MTMHSIVASASNIYCVGRNYAAHAAELNNEIPSEPVLFGKDHGCLTLGPVLNFPKALGTIHYESELVLRIGVPVPLGKFRDLGCVAQIGVGIDFTARELQTSLKQKGLPWFRAKSFVNSAYLADGFRPIPEGDITFKLYRNEELSQSGCTSDMIFKYHHILEFINTTMPLDPGDLIFTGTPAGVGPADIGDRFRLVCEALNVDSSFEIGPQC